MLSPLIRSIAFWGTFYGTYHYARKDELTHQHVYPSYVILKQKIICDSWKDGFES